MTEVEMLSCGHAEDEFDLCLRDGCLTGLQLEALEKSNEIPSPPGKVMDPGNEMKLDLSHLLTEKQLDKVADSDLPKAIKKKLLAGLDYVEDDW